MYLNLTFCLSKGLLPSDIINLQMLRQLSTEPLILPVIEQYVSTLDIARYNDMGLLSAVKKKKKTDSEYSTLRLSKKGASLLEDLQIPEYNSDDEVMYGWLENYYKSHNKEIGSVKKSKMYLALFRAHSGISRNSLAFLCKQFLETEEEFQWSFRLEYLFFKPTNVFTVKFSLDNSRLWNFYEKNKDYYDKKFLELNNN